MLKFCSLRVHVAASSSVLGAGGAGPTQLMLNPCAHWVDMLSVAWGLLRSLSAQSADPVLAVGPDPLPLTDDSRWPL